MLARIEGIAEGAQLRPGSLCLLNALEALVASLEGRMVRPIPGACSAVAVRGTRSRPGEPMIAQNFDYVPLVQPFYAVRESRPRGGFRSLDFIVAPLAGTVDGLNEKGLCITYNYGFVIGSAAPAPLISMAIADALAACSTVPEAVERIRARPRWGAGILMRADATGNLAALELTASRAEVREPAPGEDLLSHTNVYACPGTDAVQVSADATFAGRVPSGLAGKPDLEPHATRAGRIASLLASCGPLDPDGLARLMADHGPAGHPDTGSPCVHGDYWYTTACLQLFPTRRLMRVSFSTACQARYTELTLSA